MTITETLFLVANVLVSTYIILISIKGYKKCRDDWIYKVSLLIGIANILGYFYLVFSPLTERSLFFGHVFIRAIHILTLAFTTTLLLIRRSTP